MSKYLKSFYFPKIITFSRDKISNYIMDHIHIGVIMADEKDILEELIDARMASEKELKNLELGKERPLAANIKDRMGMTGDLAENMVPDEELAERMKGVATIDDLSKGTSKSGSRMANKAETSMLSKLGSKLGGKGLGKVAAGIAGLPMLLASEAADASEVGESPEDEDIMIAEAQARKDYSRSPARADKVGLEHDEEFKKSDEDYFKELRAIKDKRSEKVSERLSEQGDEELKEMLDLKDRSHDIAEEGLSMEDKERIAAEYRTKRRKELGLE